MNWRKFELRHDVFLLCRLSSGPDHAGFLLKSLGFQTFQLERDSETRVRCKDGILCPSRYWYF
jgi:hypothetical protein